ncbi:hypothetical protein S40293_10518 [Stachybotrys chartarum IBT 40293]|nr:hypothetical protein S40293_10518 [Stachybotrys chartarum IBT 40293]
MKPTDILHVGWCVKWAPTSRLHSTRGGWRSQQPRSSASRRRRQHVQFWTSTCPHYHRRRFRVQLLDRGHERLQPRRHYSQEHGCRPHDTPGDSSEYGMQTPLIILVTSESGVADVGVREFTSGAATGFEARAVRICANTSQPEPPPPSASQPAETSTRQRTAIDRSITDSLIRSAGHPLPFLSKKMRTVYPVKRRSCTSRDAERVEKPHSPPMAHVLPPPKGDPARLSSSIHESETHVGQPHLPRPHQASNLFDLPNPAPSRMLYLDVPPPVAGPRP